MQLRSYPEIQAVVRRLDDLVHKYLPDYNIVITHPKNIPHVGENMPRKKEIRLNRDLLEQASLEDIEGVVRHEIAHTFQIPKSSDHGNDFQSIARSLGSKFTTSRSNLGFGTKPPRFRYRCVTCGLEFMSPRITLPEMEMRNQDEPMSHAFDHQDFYVMDMITRQKWKVYR